MEGIDCQFILLEHIVEKGVGIDLDGVGSIFARHVLTVLDAYTFRLRIDVLIEFAAECSRDNLDAFANAEHRNLTVGSETNQQQFLFVALWAHGMQLRNGLFAQQQRIDIATAAEEDAIERVEVVLQVLKGFLSVHVRNAEWRNDDRDATGTKHGLIVAFGNRTLLVFVVARDTNHRTLFSLGEFAMEVIVFFLEHRLG